MDYCILKYPSVIPAYGERGLFGSLDYKTNNFLPRYASEKDLSEINKFIDAWEYRPSSDLIDTLFTDKLNTTKFSTLQLISQMRERQNIKKRNLENIDYRMDHFKSQLAQVEDLCLYNEIFDLNNKKMKINLEEKISGLDKEKRAEDVSCWRDLTQLRKELIDSIGEYKTASRKRELIAYPGAYSLEAEVEDDKYN